MDLTLVPTHTKGCAVRGCSAPGIRLVWDDHHLRSMTLCAIHADRAQLGSMIFDRLWEHADISPEECMTGIVPCITAHDRASASLATLTTRLTEIKKHTVQGIDAVIIFVIRVVLFLGTTLIMLIVAIVFLPIHPRRVMRAVAMEISDLRYACAKACSWDALPLGLRARAVLTRVRLDLVRAGAHDDFSKVPPSHRPLYQHLWIVLDYPAYAPVARCQRITLVIDRFRTTTGLDPYTWPAPRQQPKEQTPS